VNTSLFRQAEPQPREANLPKTNDFTDPAAPKSFVFVAEMGIYWSNMLVVMGMRQKREGRGGRTAKPEAFRLRSRSP